MAKKDISKILNKINECSSKSIKLLRNKEVVQWIHGDLSFLKGHTSLKDLENKWGRKVLKSIRGDLKLKGAWSGKMGEHLLEEVCELNGIECNRPVKKKNHCPDLETEQFIWEVKTSTYGTKGTANEKILGTPIKYRNIFNLYDKPLRIVCVANAEKESIHKYGNLGGKKHDENMKKILEFYKNELNIEYVGLTDLLT